MGWMGRWQDEGLSAPPDKEQCLHHKPKARSRDSAAVLTIGDSLPALKTSGGKKGEEICSVLSDSPELLLPGFSTFPADQPLSTLQCCLCWFLPEHKEMFLKG